MDAALERAGISVSGAWADGRAVVVELAVKRFDRVFDIADLTLDGDRQPVDFRCVHPDDNVWQHCHLDEAARRVRLRFETPGPRGTHALDWSGRRVATFEVDGPGAPVFPGVDEAEAERLEARIPTAVAVAVGVPVNDDVDFEAEPARRYIVTDTTVTGAPSTFVPADVVLELADPETGDVFVDAGVEAVAEQCWSVDGATRTELLDCVPLPKNGVLRTVWSVPLDAERAEVVSGALGLLEGPLELGPEDALASVRVDAHVLEQLDEPGEPLPIAPVRVWRVDWSLPHLWADFVIDGPIPPTPEVDDLQLYDPVTGEAVTRSAPQVECYAEDPDTGPAEPTGCSQGGWLRAGWSVPDVDAPSELVVGSGGVAVAERVSVLAEGPVFSDRYTATRLLELGDAAGAIPYFDRALVAEPEDGWLRYGRAYAAWSTGDHRQAAGLAEAALAVEGEAALTVEERVEAWKVLSNALLDAEGIDAAEPVLLAARAELPDEPAFPLLLATVAQERLDFPDAEAWLVEAHADARGADPLVVAEIELPTSRVHFCFTATEPMATTWRRVSTPG